MNTGLMLPISANTGIGSGRALAASNNARPPLLLPVNATALANGCRTSVSPISCPRPLIMLNRPAGSLRSAIAQAIAPATSSEVPGWFGWFFTTTGHPAANALTRSLPATDMAKGKLLEENETTGPTPTSSRRMSGFGSGLRSGIARSMRASTQEPSSASRANIRSWPQVRARSPVSRGSPRAVSWLARSSRPSPRASMLAAIASSRAARVLPSVLRKVWNASWAADRARSASAAVPSWKSPGSGWLVDGSVARKTSPCPLRSPAMRFWPWRFMAAIMRRRGGER